MTDQRLSPAFASGNVAVITGAASGIGLAAATRLAGAGMRVVLADLPGGALDGAAAHLAASGADVLAVSTDLAERDALGRLADAARDRFGPVSVLMNNAGIGRHPGLPWEDSAALERL